MQHVYVTDPAGKCKYCGGIGPSLATECPGRRVHAQLLDAVAAGVIDYRDDNWIDGPELEEAA